MTSEVQNVDLETAEAKNLKTNDEKEINTTEMVATEGNVYDDGDDSEPSKEYIDTDYLSESEQMDDSCWCPRCHCCPGKCDFSLTAATITAAVLAIVLGLIVQSQINGAVSENVAKVVKYPGELWVRALKLLVLPLIAFMMMNLPSKVINIGRVGKIGIPFYLLTSTLAALQGTIWSLIIRPGTSADNNADLLGKIPKPKDSVSLMDSILNVGRNAIPSNIVASASSLQVLGVITFSLTFGILLRRIDKGDRDVILKFCRGMLKCTMIAINWVIFLAPIGMFSLVLERLLATNNLIKLLEQLAMYLLTATIGQTFHFLIVLPIIYLIIVRQNPYKHLWKVLPATFLAFATSSSAATLPKSVNVAKDAGLAPDVYEFLIPLGSAINMDGTAQGFPIMIAFISNLFGKQLTPGEIVSVFILSIVISIGTSPVPNAGMVYVIMLLEAVGLGEYETDALAFLFTLDWFVDRLETAINVTSDQFIAKWTDTIIKRRLDKQQ